MSASPDDALPRNILVIVSGGVAAYKSADLVSRLVRSGAAVRVVMTRAAREFVAPLTFEALSGHPVFLDVFDSPGGATIDHIAWARWADCAVVAPATANLLAKMAHGLADDAATTLLLAFERPVHVAPAMNRAMWAHPATRHNLALLRERGVRVIDPGAGRLACGEVGEGRMAEPQEIMEAILGSLVLPASIAQSLAGRRVLITAGPTREALDAVRFLSNRSSGEMAAELAREALRRGAEVTFIHGPLKVAVPGGCRAVAVVSAREMLAAVQHEWPAAQIAIFAAAVANYEPAHPAAGKLKAGATFSLELRRTPDIAAWAGANRRAGQFLIGFAAESENLMAEAARKLKEKKLDLICANPIGDPEIGFDAADNEITLLKSSGETTKHPPAPKARIAAWIWDEVRLCLTIIF